MTSPFLNNWSDEPEEEPVEHLGPRALARAREHAHETAPAHGDSR